MDLRFVNKDYELDLGDFSDRLNETTFGDHFMPNFHSFKVGAFKLSVISDGCFDIAPLSRFSPNADQATLENTLKTHSLPTDKVTLPINILTIDSGQRRVLIDCGSGHSFVEGTGLFSESSAAVNPLEIDAIALSHAHPDHVGGLIASDNQYRFPNATCFIDQKEWQFWTDPTLTLPQDQHSLITTARAALSLIDNNTEKLSTQTEILPGITMLPSYGHTPGHHSVLIESDGESLLCVGDIFPHPLTSFAYPEWGFGFDIDPDQAIATRKRSLDTAASEQLRVFGYHLPYPGLGYVVRRGRSYRWIPES